MTKKQLIRQVRLLGYRMQWDGQAFAVYSKGVLVLTGRDTEEIKLDLYRVRASDRELLACLHEYSQTPGPARVDKGRFYVRLKDMDLGWGMVLHYNVEEKVWEPKRMREADHYSVKELEKLGVDVNNYSLILYKG